MALSTTILQGPPPAPPRGPAVSGSQRRMKVYFTTAVTILAVTALVVVGNVVSERYHARFDMTAAGTQKLSPRTSKLLVRLQDQIRIVVAADYKGVDPRARDRVKDVLSEMKRSSRRIDYSLIDTGSVSGLEAYKALLRDLVRRDRSLIDDQTAAINLSSTAAQALSAYMGAELSNSLLQVQSLIPGVGADPNRRFFETAAANARVMSQDLSAAVTQTSELLARKLDDIPLPATDAAARTMGDVLSRAVDQLSELSRQLRKFAEQPANAGVPAQAARSIITTVDHQRDQTAVLLESLRRLKRLDLLRIADALRSGNAALIIGPQSLGITAMDLDLLMPSTAWLDATGLGKADLNRRVEELITTGIGSMLSPFRPIAVLVHAERPFFDQPQIVERNFGAVFNRLQFHGIDIIEWAVVQDNAPPRLASLNPEGKRPVVYIIFPADSTEGSDSTGSSGAQRATKLGEVATELAKQGKNLLISVNPSFFQTYGSPDPMAPALEHFNLIAATGRPILREEIRPEGRIVHTEHVVFPDETTGVLAGAIQGLPMLMPGPVALHIKPGDPKTPHSVWRLYSIPVLERIWAESQWLPLWQTPRNQRHLMPNPPVFDEGRDVRQPTSPSGERESTWLVAAAVELRHTRAPTQRLVAVGSREWFSTMAVSPRVSIDGRSAAVYPGNMELFEASVFWLAGHDDLIAQSPSAQTVALIQPMDVKVLSGLRMTMMIGLPLAVLALGVVYRLIRG
jgi:hypothetical protein